MVEIVVCFIFVLLVMKGYVIEGWFKQKDVYDIYYCVCNYFDGIEVFVEVCWLLLDYKVGFVGYQYIVGKFDLQDGFGFICVCKFVEESQVFDS